MPREYEAIRDSLVRLGKSYDEAQRIAAAKYNEDHPDNPNPWRKERVRRALSVLKGGHGKSK